MIQILKKIPFFRNLPANDLEKISEKTEMQYFPPDHIIFEEALSALVEYNSRNGCICEY